MQFDSASISIRVLRTSRLFVFKSEKHIQAGVGSSEYLLLHTWKSNPRESFNDARFSGGIKESQITKVLFGFKRK